MVAIPPLPKGNPNYKNLVFALDGLVALHEDSMLLYPVPGRVKAAYPEDFFKREGNFDDVVVNGIPAEVIWTDPTNPRNLSIFEKTKTLSLILKASRKGMIR